MPELTTPGAPTPPRPRRVLDETIINTGGMEPITAPMPPVVELPQMPVYPPMPPAPPVIQVPVTPSQPVIQLPPLPVQNPYFHLPGPVPADQIFELPPEPPAPVVSAPVEVQADPATSRRMTEEEAIIAPAAEPEPAPVAVQMEPEVQADPATEPVLREDAVLRSAQDDGGRDSSAHDDGVGVPVIEPEEGVIEPFVAAQSAEPPVAAPAEAAVAPVVEVPPEVPPEPVVVAPVEAVAAPVLPLTDRPGIPFPPAPPEDEPTEQAVPAAEPVAVPVVPAVPEVQADPATPLRSAQDDGGVGSSAQDGGSGAAGTTEEGAAGTTEAGVQPEAAPATAEDAAFNDWYDPAPRIGAQISAERDEPPTRVRSIIAFSVVGLMAVSLVVMAIVLLRMNILPTGLFVTILVLEAALIGGLAALMLTSRIAARQTRYVVGILVSVMLVIINATVAFVGNGYTQMLNNIQAPATDTIQYDIVGLTSGPGTLDGIANKQMGWDSTDVNKDAVKTQVDTMVKGVVMADEPDWSTAVNNLINGQYPSIVIQDAQMQIFSDADPNNYNNVKVLGTFSVQGTDDGPGSTFTPLPPSSTDQPFIVYISGIDTSGVIANRARSDVNQLMVVNPQTGKVLLVNTPRDFYVTLADMPNCDLKDKLTHSGVYGIGVSVDTMNALYGININYYVRLNFSSLVTVVDALGGIDVNSQWAFTASEGACQGLPACPSFTKGINHLDGAHALAFSRERHNVPGGDRGRGTDQQAVISAILSKATQPSSLMNYPAIISAISGSIQTSMTPDQISAQIKQQIADGTNWKVTSMSVTGADDSQYTCSYPHQKLYVMDPDQTSVNAAKTAIQNILDGN